MWGVASRGGALQKSKAKHQSKCATTRHLKGIYSHAYSRLLFWKFMHIHYFTWLKYPLKPIVSFRVQIQLVWLNDDGPLKAPHALVDSVPSCSCFPIQPVCVCLKGTTTGVTQGDKNAHFCVIWLGSLTAWLSPILVRSHVQKFVQTRYAIIVCSCVFTSLLLILSWQFPFLMMN